MAALRITSITRDAFSSTTLWAIQVPYRMIIMKIRIVIPKPSMSCPIISDVPRVGPVLAGSGQATPKSVGANRLACSAGATPRRASRSAIAMAVEACRISPAVRPVALSLV